jgi:hypothetical protein
MFKKYLGFSLLIICNLAFARTETPYVHLLDKCEQKNLSQWQDATRQVLEDAKARLTAVFYCPDKYPIFAASFPYDPMSSQTSSFFYALYDKLLTANNRRAYSIISDGTQVTHVKIEKGEIQLDYEQLAESDTPPGIQKPVVQNENCFSFPTGSVLNEDGHFRFFKDASCKHPLKVMPFHSDFVSAFIGWKMNYLIFQEGTDVNSQTLLLVDMYQYKTLFELHFVDDWQVGGSEILFYSPLDREAKADECSSQAEDIKAWRDHGATIGIAQQKRFDLLTQTISDLDSSYCFPLQ